MSAPRRALPTLAPHLHTAYAQVINRPMGTFGTKKALERLESALQALTIRVEDGERASRGLHTEWLEHYDKTSRLMSRMAKRHAIDKKENGVDPDPDPVTEDPDELDPISAKIHARRTRGFLTQ